jgi:hypothetical protein
MSFDLVTRLHLDGIRRRASTKQVQLAVPAA